MVGMYFIDVYGIEIISLVNDSKNFGVWHMSSRNDLLTVFLEAVETGRDHRIVILLAIDGGDSQNGTAIDHK